MKVPCIFVAVKLLLMAVGIVMDGGKYCPFILWVVRGSL
jgi:hypothetical protein